MSTVCKDNDGCAKIYMFALGIYSITVLSSSYGIIMDRAVNVPSHRKNVSDGPNAMDKYYLKEQM